MRIEFIVALGIIGYTWILIEVMRHFHHAGIRRAIINRRIQGK